MLKTILEDKAYFRRLLLIALPIAFQNLMLAMVAAADAIMLGRLDQDSMAAVSLATQVQFVLIMMLCAIVVGISILGAQYWGKNDRSVIDEVFAIGIRLTSVISIAFFIGCYFFPSYLMKCFANDANLIAIGAKYLKIASWSYLISGLSQCYLAVMKVTDKVTQAAWISTCTVIINIILNAIMIFGLAGCPSMGAEGAAYATLLARIAELASCAALSLRNGYVRIKFGNLIRWNRLLSLDFLKCSMPVMGSYMLWGVGFTAYTAIVGHLGSDAAAANSIAAVVRDLMCCLCNGLGAASAITIGNELGAGQLEAAKKHGDCIMKLSFGVGVFSTLVVISTIPIVLRYMKLSDAAREYIVGMFIIMAIYMIGRCFNTIVENGIFTAGGDTFFDTYTLAICMWGVALPCAFISAFWLRLPVLVVYACTCLDEVGKIPWVVYHHYRYKWVKNLTR